jgi:hypothetical protein
VKNPGEGLGLEEGPTLLVELQSRSPACRGEVGRKVASAVFGLSDDIDAGGDVVDQTAFGQDSPRRPPKGFPVGTKTP